MQYKTTKIYRLNYRLNLLKFTVVIWSPFRFQDFKKNYSNISNNFTQPLSNLFQVIDEKSMKIDENS